MVFSTYVEVILCRWWWCQMVWTYSPRMWRWSSLRRWSPWSCLVFSTYVEVILGDQSRKLTGIGILHVCGGDPEACSEVRLLASYSPRMLRWSCYKLGTDKQWVVFSTYVEVILLLLNCSSDYSCILHVCGGDPLVQWMRNMGMLYSPHMLRVLLSLSAQINSL